MHDITMCVSQGCSWRLKCYRFTAGSYQSYADFYNNECKDGYKMYIPGKEVSLCLPLSVK